MVLVTAVRGDRTKWLHSDRMVYGQSGTDKMVTTFLQILIQVNSIYISNQKSQISDKHTEEA